MTLCCSNPQLVYDYSSSKCCSNCGIVSSEPELKQSEWKERASAAPTGTTSNAGSATTRTATSRTNRTKTTATTDTTQSQLLLKEELGKILATFKLPSSYVDEIWTKVKVVNKERRYGWGEKGKILAAACVFLAMKEKGISISSSLLVQDLGINRRWFHRVLQKAAKTLGYSGLIYPGQFVPSLCQVLCDSPDVSTVDENELKKLAEYVMYLCHELVEVSIPSVSAVTCVACAFVAITAAEISQKLLELLCGSVRCTMVAVRKKLGLINREIRRLTLSHSPSDLFTNVKKGKGSFRELYYQLLYLQGVDDELGSDHNNEKGYVVI